MKVGALPEAPSAVRTVTTAGAAVSTQTVARVPATRRSSGPMSRSAAGMTDLRIVSGLHPYYPAGGRTPAGCDLGYRRFGGVAGCGGWDAAGRI